MRSSASSRGRGHPLGVSGVLTSARRARKLLRHGGHAEKLLRMLQRDLAQTEAEVGGYVTEPHRLFQPLSIAAVLLIPLGIPLAFMPSQALVLYFVGTVMWYLIAVCYLATEVAIRPPWYRRSLVYHDLPPYWKGFVRDPLSDLGLPHEEVEFLNRDGLVLRGWYIPAPSSETLSTAFPRPALKGSSLVRYMPTTGDRVAVCVHGAGRDRRNFLRHVEAFSRDGWAVLLFDTSEHGLSDSISASGNGRGTSFGAREQHDVVAAVEYVRIRKRARYVAVIGSSAGGSSAILAAARRPELIDVVVAENPFTRPDHLLVHHLQRLSENYLARDSNRIIRSFVFWLAGRILSWRLGSCAAVDAAPLLKCPLLVAHSPADDVVPYSHGRAIYDAARKAKSDDECMVSFLRMEDAAHCALYDKDPQQWAGVVVPFIEKAVQRVSSYHN